MPTVSEPGMGAWMRTATAERARLISSLRLAILLTLTPAAGLISNMVTTGPGVIRTSSPEHQNPRDRPSVFCLSIPVPPLVDIFWSFFAGIKAQAKAILSVRHGALAALAPGWRRFSAGFSSFCASTKLASFVFFRALRSSRFSGTGEDTSHSFRPSLPDRYYPYCEASKGMEQTSGSLSGPYKIFKFGSSVMKGFF